MKKILALLLAVLMVASMAACAGKDDSKTPTGETIKITLWTPEEDQGAGGWLEERLAAFKKTYPNIEIELGIMSEGNAGDTIKSDPSAAADVYMFANDQMGTLHAAGALAKLGGAYKEQVINDNNQLVVDTVTYTDNEIYGFPFTNNTWFLYYNKSLLNEEDIKTMDGMLAKGKVAMQMGTAWYTASFFTSNGCTMFGDKGLEADKGIAFGGQAGYEAAEAMINLCANPNFVNDADGAGVAGLKDGSIAAIFSGSWDYGTLSKDLGENLGCAALPTITIAGQQKQLRAFAGSKAVGVNPHSKQPKAAMDLAAFLANKESQEKHFEMRGIIPCHKELANTDAVKASAVAQAEIAVMTNCASIQPTIPELGSFWSPMGNFGSQVYDKKVVTDESAAGGEVTYYKDAVDLLYNQLNGETL